MNLKHLPQSLKVSALALILGSGAAVTHAEINYYECVDMGFISTTHKTAVGTVATSNKGTEIMLVKDNKLQTLVSGPGAGMYVNYSKDGKYVGFKKIDNKTGEQAPAVLDLTTGAVRLLESYVNQCGQVSFADDGTMAYTVGNDLIVRKGDSRRKFSLGTYVNIANISPDATQVAYSDLDGNSFILNVATGSIEKFAEGGGYRAIWSPDGKKLALQYINGDAASYDKASRTVYPLGQVNSISWADNSEELVVTRSERVNDFQVKGATVVKMSYKGANQQVLVGHSESVPVSAEIDGNVLTVAYATGDLRGVTTATYSGSVRAGAPAKVRSLYKAGAARIGVKSVDDFMGSVRPDYTKMTQEEAQALENNMDGMDGRTKGAPKKGNDIGLTAIPYINQVWDTPACDGSPYAYGYICCAPTSSCMMLAWYGKFKGKEKWTSSRSSANPAKGTNYSWFISKAYTSVSGYTFNKYISGQGGYWGYSNNVAGGYGYMWGYGAPNTMMDDFHKNNGAKSSWFESSLSRLRTECKANRPYIICLANGTGGHVVMVFRADQIAANDGSSAWAKSGSFICHDPYGDYNSSSYPNWDGRYSSYDWPGVNNGRANIGAVYWGCCTQCDAVQPSTPATPKITVNPQNVHFTCKVNEHPTATVTVKGENLSADITVASITPGRFPTSVSSLPKTGGSFTITFANSDKAGTYRQGGTAVDYSFFVRVKSGSTEKVINITADVTAPPLSGITEKYNYSKKRGNASAKGYDMSQIRNFCYKDGKLYCVYESSRILVLNAQTGEKLGFLSNGDVVIPAAAKLADIKCIDGVLVASNIGMTTDNAAGHTKKLRLYAWENDNAKPYLLFETDDFQGATRMGDCLEMTGNFKTDCWFAFAQDYNNQTRIVEYNRKDGAWTAKNTPVFDKAGKALRAMATIRAYPKGTGWWIDGKNSVPAWVTWDDGLKGAKAQCYSLDGDIQRGSCHHEFYWKGQKYAANLVFPDASGANARMRIIQDNAGDFSNTSEIGKYPSDGLGDDANSNGTGDIMINTDGQTYLEAWVLSTNQGLAYFTTGNVPSQSPAPVNPDDVTETNPVISANPGSISLSAKVGESATGNLAVTGKDLRSNITMYIEGAGASHFSVSPSTLSASGTVTIDYHPTAAGSHSATLVINSQDATAVRVALRGTATSAQPTYTYDDEVGQLDEQWLYSQAKGNLASASWFSIAKPETRSIAVIGDNLYVLNAHLANNEISIAIVDANTGAKKGNLSVNGLTTGGQYALASGLAAVGNDLYLVNATRANGTDPVRIYKYTNGQGEPAKVFEGLTGLIANTGVGAGPNCVTIASATAVYKFDVNNMSNPTKITVEVADPSTFASEANFEADGSFWLNSKAIMPTHFNASGAVLETLSADGVNAQGSSSAIFSYGKKKYVATIATGDGWNQGKMVLVDVTNGAANGAATQALPAASFGTGNWGASVSGCTKIVHQLSGNQNSMLKLWALVPMQGIGMWKFNGETQSAVENIAIDAAEVDTEAAYYNLQGVRVDNTNLTPGFYIRRTAATASKVYVK